MTDRLERHEKELARLRGWLRAMERGDYTGTEGAYYSLRGYEAPPTGEHVQRPHP